MKSVLAQELPNLVFPEYQIKEELYDEPPYSISKNFLQHIEKTHHPILFTGLSFRELEGGLKGSVIIKCFDIDRNKVQKENWIPCLFCGRKRQFLQGALIWSPDHRIRLIGNCCAKKHFGNDYSILQKNYEQKRENDLNVDFLISNLEKIPFLLLEVEKLGFLSETMMGNRNKFKAGFRELYKFLQKVSKAGGNLTIEIQSEDELTQFILNEQKQGTYKTENIHKLMGQEFLDNFNPYEKYNWILENLKKFNFKTDDERQEYILQIIKDDNHLSKITKEMKDIANEIYELHIWLKNAVMFFSLENLDGLKKYRSHPNCTMPFRIDVLEDDVKFYKVPPHYPTTLKIGKILRVPDILIPKWE
jgi:hypothetical protein